MMRRKLGFETHGRVTAWERGFEGHGKKISRSSFIVTLGKRPLIDEDHCKIDGFRCQNFTANDSCSSNGRTLPRPLLYLAR